MKAEIILPIQSSIRAKLLLVLFEISKPVYRFVFKRKQKAWQKDIKQLLNYAPHTLGNDLALFLLKNRFNLEPKLEKHDIYHIISGYSTTIIGEIELSWFNIGVGKRSLYTLGVAGLGALLLIEYFACFRQAYQRGKTARNYSRWNFENLLNENTEELKKHIFYKENHLEIYI